MGIAAVVLFAVGVAAGGWDGDSVAGWGQVLIGVAAVIAALAGLRNGSRIKAAEVKADVAAVKADAAAAHAETAAVTGAGVAESIGPANGANVLQLLHEIKSFESYQHQRNHDLLRALSELSLGMPVVMALAERLLAKLNETES